MHQWLTGKKLSSIFVDATDGYRSREKGGMFQSLFLKGSRKDRERSTGPGRQRAPGLGAVLVGS